MYKNRQKRRKEAVVNYYISCKESDVQRVSHVHFMFLFLPCLRSIKSFGLVFFYPKNKKIMITKDDDSISGVLIILL